MTSDGRFVVVPTALRVADHGVLRVRVSLFRDFRGQ